MKLPQPDMSPITGENKLWVLNEDFAVDVDRYRITVKAGFKTDGESIPRPCWILTGHPFQGVGMAAAIIHDGLYGSELLSREKADLIFKKLLERYGLNWFRAMARYRFLRIFGWITWKTHTVKTISAARQFVSLVNLR